MMKEKFIKDLEDIFEKAMHSGKLNVALKVKEILGKLAGFLGSNVQKIKPLSHWSEEDIKNLIDQLEKALADKDLL